LLLYVVVNLILLRPDNSELEQAKKHHEQYASFHNISFLEWSGANFIIASIHILFILYSTYTAPIQSAMGGSTAPRSLHHPVVLLAAI
jgi:hypothetical protein